MRTPYLLSYGGGGAGKSFYAICDTAANIAEKIVVCDKFSLDIGTKITIQFTHTNTASNPTLNISNTGAIGVQFKGVNITASALLANVAFDFIYDGTYYQLLNPLGTTLQATNDTTKYYIIGQSGTSGSEEPFRKAYQSSMTENTSDRGVYFLGNTGVLMGAAWNDYAEYRKAKDNIIIPPGRVVKENGDGTLSITTDRLEAGCEIISDTFGFAIGETKNCQLPTAVAGRVLAYPNEAISNYLPGDAVCSGPNGTISKMTREEIREYPERIIGTVSEIPSYNIWHGGQDIEINGRIWIRIR